MYICKYFKIQELVYPELYEAYKHDEPKLWMLFDDRILKAMDFIRSVYGPHEVNNWHLGGPYKERGIRRMETSTGAQLSQHKFGRAIDSKPLTRGITVDQIRKDIIEMRHPELSAIACIEVDVSWLHVDCRNYNGLLLVRP